MLVAENAPDESRETVLNDNSGLPELSIEMRLRGNIQEVNISGASINRNGSEPLCIQLMISDLLGHAEIPPSWSSVSVNTSIFGLLYPAMFAASKLIAI